MVVNRQVNGDIIVRREMDGEWATLRPTDRVVRTARSRIRDFLPPAKVRRTSRLRLLTHSSPLVLVCYVNFTDVAYVDGEIGES